MERWGDRLRGRAKELGLTDAEVARRLGLAQGRYSTYVNMTREPDFATFVRMCKALQTTPDEVLGFAKTRREDGAEPVMARAMGALALFDLDTLAEASEILEVIARHRASRASASTPQPRARPSRGQSTASAAAKRPPAPTAPKQPKRASKPR